MICMAVKIYCLSTRHREIVHPGPLAEEEKPPPECVLVGGDREVPRVAVGQVRRRVARAAESHQILLGLRPALGSLDDVVGI